MNLMMMNPVYINKKSGYTDIECCYMIIFMEIFNIISGN